MVCKYATLMIDMQENFLSHKPKSNIERAIINQKKVLNYAEAQGHEIIYVLYDGFGKLSSKFQPSSHKVFKKDDMSIFTSKGLVNYLNGSDVKGLIMMGCNSSCCIKDSVIDAMNQGYQIIIPEGTLLDDHQPYFERTLNFLKERGLLKKIDELGQTISS